MQSKPNLIHPCHDKPPPHPSQTQGIFNLFVFLHLKMHYCLLVWSRTSRSTVFSCLATLLPWKKLLLRLWKSSWLVWIPLLLVRSFCCCLGVNILFLFYLISFFSSFLQGFFFILWWAFLLFHFLSHAISHTCKEECIPRMKVVEKRGTLRCILSFD